MRVSVRNARAPQAPRGLPLRAAAAHFGIDHRWIWLWASQGLVGHVEVESADGRHKTYYVLADIERARIESGTDTREYPDGYLEQALRRLGLVKLPDTALAVG